MIALSVRLTRTWFEEATRHLVDRAMSEVRKLLLEENVDAGDVEHVLLVGGASRIPQVQRALAETFGPDRINRDLHPLRALG